MGSVCTIGLDLIMLGAVDTVPCSLCAVSTVPCFLGEVRTVLFIQCAVHNVPSLLGAVHTIQCLMRAVSTVPCNCNRLLSAVHKCTLLNWYSAHRTMFTVCRLYCTTVLWVQCELYYDY